LYIKLFKPQLDLELILCKLGKWWIFDVC
jgi:hypothetical protein